VLCGFLGCDRRPFNPLLVALPRMLRVRPVDEAGERLGQLVRLAAAEARRPGAGSDCVLLRLGELMFVEMLRVHLSGPGGREVGFLAGLRDPPVGEALMLLHAEPAHHWSLAELSRRVGRSRSALSDRFAELVGLAPMQYLARWRMQLAAKRLAEGRAKVSAIASDVGYESEAAFCRAFKKLVGTAPAAWRRQHRGAS
jgi:AraC-like DNA-binding protein